MKRFVITLVLTCVLSSTTLGGDVPSVDVRSPSVGGSQPANVVSPGDVPSVDFTHQLFDAGLNLIQLMLGAGV